MGSKGPKQADYAPSEMEKAQAAISAEEQRYFEGTYQPLLMKQRDLAARERLAPTLKGRAQADTMQVLTGQTNIGLTRGLGQSADIALGAINQQLSAGAQAANAATGRQVSVLGSALGQGMAAGDALAQASRFAASKGLARAAGKQEVRMAKNQAMFNIGMSVAGQGFYNLGTGGSFFKGKAAGMGKDPRTGVQVSGLYEDAGFWGLGQPKGQFDPFDPYASGGSIPGAETGGMSPRKKSFMQRMGLG